MSKKQKNIEKDINQPANADEKYIATYLREQLRRISDEEAAGAMLYRVGLDYIRLMNEILKDYEEALDEAVRRMKMIEKHFSDD